jgi:hypothetical protein
MGDPQGPQSLKEYIVLWSVAIGCVLTAIVALPFIGLVWLLDKFDIFDER